MYRSLSEDKTGWNLKIFTLPGVADNLQEHADEGNPEEGVLTLHHALHQAGPGLHKAHTKRTRYQVPNLASTVPVVCFAAIES